jgi:hypothetical protein
MSTAEAEVWYGEAGMGGSFDAWGRGCSDVVRRDPGECLGASVDEPVRARGFAGGSSSSGMCWIVGTGADEEDNVGWCVLRLSRRPSVVVWTIPSGMTNEPVGRVHDVSPVRVW